jgi:serine/threonine protein kinase
MNLDTICVSCMEDDSGSPVCPKCGAPFHVPVNNLLLLPPRTILREQYLIGRALGHGGFGITYLAWDIGLEIRLAVKEFMPAGVAGRTDRIKAMPLADTAKEEYEWGLERFLEEARVLKKSHHPNIVAIDTVFRDNGTAYLVMEYLDGVNFAEFLRRRGGTIPFAEALEVMSPVMDALSAVHALDIVHRDVSPENIFIPKMGKIKLIDFGAARNALSHKSRNLSAILKGGYAPEEQYRASGKQGPWTDVYAAAATLYRAITGKVPVPALDRQAEDTLERPSQLGASIQPSAENALMQAMAVRAERRFQSMEEFKIALTAGVSIPRAKSKLPQPKEGVGRIGEIEVFCSYSHEDRPLRDELVKHLELLRESLLIRAWHDGELTAGQDWQCEIEDHLRGADIILLLVSVDFLASQFVRTQELPVALQRHKDGEALVIPVVLRPVPWEQSGLDFLQALPDKVRPVVLWSPHDLAYVNICEGLLSAVLVWQGRRKPPASGSTRSSAVRRRVLDLALPRRVPVRKATIFVVMVRRVGEHGLRAILEVDNRFGVSPEEVESSKSFPLEFARNEEGRLSPLDLTIAVESGDFLCQAPRKNLMVPPQGDSPICVFLLEAQHAGPLVLIVEISSRGRTILTQALRSEGVSHTPFEPVVDEFACFEVVRVPTVSDLEAKIRKYETPAPGYGAAPEVRSAGIRRRFPKWMAAASGAAVLALMVGVGVPLWRAKHPTVVTSTPAVTEWPAQPSGIPQPDVERQRQLEAQGQAEQNTAVTAPAAATETAQSAPAQPAQPHPQTSRPAAAQPPAPVTAEPKPAAIAPPPAPKAAAAPSYSDMLKQASAMLGNKQYAEAQALLNQAIAANPAGAQAYDAIAKIELYYLNQPAKAFEHYRGAIAKGGVATLRVFYGNGEGWLSISKGNAGFKADDGAHSFDSAAVIEAKRNKAGIVKIGKARHAFHVKLANGQNYNLEPGSQDPGDEVDFIVSIIGS